MSGGSYSITIVIEKFQVVMGRIPSPDRCDSLSRRIKAERCIVQMWREIGRTNARGSTIEHVDRGAIRRAGDVGRLGLDAGAAVGRDRNDERLTWLRGRGGHDVRAALDLEDARTYRAHRALVRRA